MEEQVKRLLPYLPTHTSAKISKLLSVEPKCSLNEIRLHARRPTSLTVFGRNITSFFGEADICTGEEILQTTAKLTEDSVHTYAEMMKEGFINLHGGYRIGLCGSASVQNGNIRSIYAVTSLCIRIPRAVVGVGDEVIKAISNGDRIGSALIYSPPGVGKTTLIRAVAASLSVGVGSKRVAVVDTRNEICIDEMFKNSTADFLSGYPRAAGIEIATRTLSPELVICDEIGSESEARAILSAQNTGVPLIATAHASSADELLRRPNIKILCDAGVFDRLIGISRAPGERGFSLQIKDMTEGAK